MDLPKYQSHKIVEAAKIASITITPPTVPIGGNQPEGGGIVLMLKLPEEYVEDLIPHTVSQEYFNKHQPKKGGYFVRYEDGYESYSPEQAFEEGYALIPEDDEEQ